MTLKEENRDRLQYNLRRYPKAKKRKIVIILSLGCSMLPHMRNKCKTMTKEAEFLFVKISFDTGCNDTPASKARESSTFSVIYTELQTCY